MDAIIRLESVNFNYMQGHNALSEIELSVIKGEILSITGSNGSGKSTLLHIMCGLLFPSKGKVYFGQNEISVNSLKDNKFNGYFRSSLGYVFQHSDNQLFCPTVLDELVFAPLQLGKDKATAVERAESVMKMLNIECLRDRPTYMLSGGEKKRVAIGAILTMNPSVLLMDEPMSSLDPKTRSFLIELILQLNEAGKTIVIATHQLELVDHLQSRMIVLSEQHTIERTGPCEELLADTELLIRTNLIHELWHKHGGISHKHLPPGSVPHKH